MSANIRTELVASVAMLTRDEAAAALLVSPQQLDKFRACGLLKAIKTGQGFRYSQDELKAFQRDLLGVDLAEILPKEPEQKGDADNENYRH